MNLTIDIMNYPSWFKKIIKIVKQGNESVILVDPSSDATFVIMTYERYEELKNKPNIDLDEDDEFVSDNNIISQTNMKTDDFKSYSTQSSADVDQQTSVVANDEQWYIEPVGETN